MPDCKNFKDQIFDYIDGLLPIEFRKTLNRHLDECPECSNFFEDGKAVRAQLRNLKSIRTSGDFETVLRTRISMERSLKRKGILSQSIRVPIYAAAGVIMVLVIFSVFGESDVSMNSMNDLNLSPSISNSELPTTNSENSQSPSTQIVYPMELLNSRESMMISSNRLGERITANRDSVKESTSGTRIQSVGVEF